MIKIIVLTIILIESANGAERVSGAGRIGWIGASEPEPKYFRIESLSTGLVLDLNGSEPCGDAHVILGKYAAGRQSQIWSWDDLTLLKNNYSGYYLDMAGGRESGSQLIVWPRHGGLNQKWVYQFHQQVYKNFMDFVIDVENAKNQVGSKLIAFPYHGGTNQKFTWLPVQPFTR